MKIVRNVFLVALFAAVISISSSVSAHVLDGAKEWNGHYYKVIAMTMNWKNARNFCESIGGHLATAETIEENEFIKQIFIKSAKCDYCWIGAYRDKQIWRWVTGVTMSDYFDWSNGKLNYYTLGLSRKFNGKWETDNEYYTYYFICEWEKAEDAHDSTL